MKKLTVVSTLFTVAVLTACSQSTPQSQVLGGKTANPANSENIIISENDVLIQIDDESISANSADDIKIEIDDNAWKSLNINPKR